MNQQRSGCLVFALIACIVLLGLSMAFNLMLAAGSSGKMAVRAAGIPNFAETTVVAADGDGDSDKIVVVPLRGIISGMQAGAFGETSVDDVKLQLKQAAHDAKVKAIVLHVDSPGGEVTASDTIYQAVRKFRDETKKPVVIYMGSLAASGGYYVACGGSHLIAADTTFTGSIGVIMQTLKYKQLFEKVGLETVTFKSGKFKDMLSGSRDLSDEEKEYVQKMIMQTYDKFVGIVAKERNLPEDQLRNGVADGRVISGKDALEAKLIDQTGQIEDAYAKAIELGKAANAQIVRYESPFKFRRLLGILGESEPPRKIEVDLATGLLPKLEAGKAYYLPSHFAP
jgi:protease-4